MTQPYGKGPLTFNAQLALMESRGMAVGDRIRALDRLQHLGYYRLSAYSYVFRIPGDRFRPGTTFERVVELYEFDRRLRLLVLDAIERVEIGFRTAVTYHFAHAHGAFGHTDPANFDTRFSHAKWLEQADREAEASSEEFVAHYRATYDGFPRLPLWMTTELMSFGSLSKLVAHLLPRDQRSVAAPYGVRPYVLTTWLRALTIVRNLCAHHARLWNRRFVAYTPAVPHDPRWQPPNALKADKLFCILAILNHLLRVQGQDVDWRARITAEIKPEARDPSGLWAMGLPANWEAHPLWV